MNTKYKIGQSVWFMESNKPCEGKITEITIKPNIKNEILIVYQIEAKTSRLETNIEDSKDKLMYNIFNKN